MPNEISINYDEVSEYGKHLGANLIPALLESGEQAMGVATTYLLGQIPPYPPLSPATRLRSPDGSSFLQTDKQRKWFFANLHEGKIAGWRIDAEGKPFKFATNRSGNLGRNFTTSVSTKSGIITGEIGTATPYAPWVVGDSFPGSDINGTQMYQAKIHTDRWWQFVEEMQKGIPDAEQRFIDEFFTYFKDNF